MGTLVTRLQDILSFVCCCADGGEEARAQLAPLSKTSYLLMLTDHRDIPVGGFILSPQRQSVNGMLGVLPKSPHPPLPGNGHCWCIYSP